MGLRELSQEFTRVTPTRRLAHDLRARIDAEQASSGLDVWRSADVITWDELIERMFALDRQAGRISGRWMPASAAQVVWERIVRDDAEAPPLVSMSGVAHAACASWRRMHEYAIARSELAGQGTPESEAFARWCGRYACWLAAHDSVDVSLAQQQVTPGAAAPGLELVGFDHLTPAQEALLERLRAGGIAVRHAAQPAAQARVTKVPYRDRAAEFEAAARWAADLLDHGAAARLAIVVPDLARHREEVRRIVERVMSPATGLTGGPLPESHRFELAAARPLTAQPVVAAALDLLDTLTGAPDAAATSRLLRNPFIPGADAEAAERARLDVHLRRTVGPGGIDLDRLAPLAAGRGCPQLARCLTSARAIIAAWPEISPPSVCIRSLFDLMDLMVQAESAQDSAEYQAEQRWRQLVAEFGSLDDVTGDLSPAHAARLLRDLASQVLFEPQEVRAPLLVIDPETCAGMRFDAVWVCGLDAARWPMPAAPDPFLPLAAQRRHGVPRASAELARREARETLDRLLQCASDVVLSVPQIEDDAPLLPSPLLADIAAGEPAAAWLEPSVAAAQFAQRPPLDMFVDQTMPRPGADEASVGGTRLLELQSACPFRAQAELRLGAARFDDPEPGVGAAERGELVHAALAHVWRTLGDQAALRALDPAGVTTLVRRSVAAVLEPALAAVDAIERHLLGLEADLLAARILEILEHDRAREPFAIEAVEAPCTLKLAGLTLTLRPDRVDRLQDGLIAVIDYKTGEGAQVRAWLDERPRLPQVPAYALALGFDRVAVLAFARIRSGDTGYAGLARHAMNFPGVKVVGGRGAPAGCDSWVQVTADWRRRLETLAAEFAGGDARLADDPARACRHCHLGALCRIAQARPAASTADDHA